MEPRTDTGMETAEVSVPSEDKLPEGLARIPFDAVTHGQKHTLQDVCFIMDRLLACDVRLPTASSRYFCSPSTFSSSGCISVRVVPLSVAIHVPVAT